MKKVICLLVASVLLLCGCTPSAQPKETTPLIQQYETSPNEQPKETTVFSWNENGNLVSAAGVEYVFLSIEGQSDLSYLGSADFFGHIQGEPETSTHLMLSYQTGMYSVKSTDNILIRYAPNNEWRSIYRKASLPAFDFSLDNCSRLEYVPGHTFPIDNTQHITCGGGITDKDEIRQFVSDVKSQPSPEDAGLYELVKQPDGSFENFYYCGYIYGYFENEASLFQCLSVLSYNDQAYSVMIANVAYVLPTSWVQRLQTGCSEK